MERTKLRLLVLASTYPRWKGDHEPGFVHELARRLAGTFEVVVLGPSAPGASSGEVLDGVKVARYRYAPRALETLVNDGGIITNLKRAPWKWLLVPGFLLGQLLATWRLVRREKPDLIHAHWLVPQGFLVALLRCLDRRVPPFVVTSHGADLFALRGRIPTLLKRWVAARARAVTVVSGALREELLRLGVDPDKVTVEPMGVDVLGRFAACDITQRSRDEILFVGRLVEKKGLRQLIDAMPAILASHPEAHLTVAGFGPEEAERRAQAERLGLGEKVRFLGGVPQSQLPALYRRAAVFVAPFVVSAHGDQEGLGLVMVEALACGCPVVAGAVPAVRDVITDPDVATLVSPGDAHALARAVTAVLSEGNGDVEARVQAATRFDWTRRAAAYANLMKAQVVD